MILNVTYHLQADEKDSDYTIHRNAISYIKEDLDARDHDTLVERVNHAVADSSDDIFTGGDRTEGSDQPVKLKL